MGDAECRALLVEADERTEMPPAINRPDPVSASASRASEAVPASSLTAKGTSFAAASLSLRFSRQRSMSAGFGSKATMRASGRCLPRRT